MLFGEGVEAASGLSPAEIADRYVNHLLARR